MNPVGTSVKVVEWGSITINLSITTAQPDVILVQGTVKDPTGECDVIRLKSSYHLASIGFSEVCNVECRGARS